MIRSTAVILSAVTLVLAQPVDGSAQVRRFDNGLTRQEMVQRIQRQYEDRMARELELDADQRGALGGLLRSYAEARSAMLPRRREIGREIRELLAGDRDEGRAAELLEELAQIRRAEAELLEEEEARLLEVLRPTQVLHLQTLRDQFGEQIRRLGAPDAPGRGRLGRDFP